MKRFGVIFILLLTLAGFAFVPKAQAIQPINDYGEFNTTVDKLSATDRTAQQWYITNQQGGLMGGFLMYAIGSPNPQSTFYYKKSALAYMDGVITSVYQTPPANLALWLNDTGQSLGFIPKQAYAQGIGFTGLTALLDIWKAFRNIAYAVLAAIMIVIGFMIMFRQKIDPKTVVTVQNALPRIVVALLLITFSYAIVGLMIDLMYVVLTLVVSVMVSASHGSLGADTASSYLSGGFGVLFKGIFSGSIQSLDDIVAFFTGPVVTSTAVGLSGLGFLGTLVAAGTASVGTAAPLVAAAVPILAIVILAIVILFAVIRLFFLLVGAYIQIIISLITAPFQLLMVAFPGNNTFTSWISNLSVNLLVFPITAALILVANILANLETHPTGLLGPQGQALWTPPLLGGTGHGVAGIIAIGMLLSIPTIVNGLKESLKVKPLIPGGGIGGVAGAAGAIGQYGFQYIMQKRMETTYKNAATEAAKNSVEKTADGGGGSGGKRR